MAADRALLAAVSRLLPPERWSSFAVSPQTLRRWHRALLQGKRRRRPRRPGRPPLAAETRLAGAICASRVSCGSSESTSRPPRSRPCCASRASGRRRAGSALAGPSSCAPKRRACSAPVSPLSPLADSRATSPRGALRLGKRPAAWKPRSSPPTAPRSGPLGRCQVCRRCWLSPLCLLPATRRPRHCGHRSNGTRAMGQGHAGALCARERFGRGQPRRLLAPGLQVATTVRFPGAPRDSSP
jgi:hypothetical protein